MDASYGKISSLEYLTWHLVEGFCDAQHFWLRAVWVSQKKIKFRVVSFCVHSLVCAAAYSVEVRQVPNIGLRRHGGQDMARWRLQGVIRDRSKHCNSYRIQRETPMKHAGNNPLPIEKRTFLQGTSRMARAAHALLAPLVLV